MFVYLFFLRKCLTIFSLQVAWMLDFESSISNAGIHCTFEGVAGLFFFYE